MRRKDPTKITTNIFEYVDFKSYLKDLAAEYKKKRPHFTLRHFADKAGLKSPGLLKMVIDGDRRLTFDTTQSFCQAFDITGKEKRYFETLVQYTQAKDPDRKRQYLEELNSLRPRSQRFTLAKKHHRYLTRDYYVTIREMVALADFREDYDFIAARCCPPIPSMEAKEAVETLLELRLLKRDTGGQLQQTDAFVHTTDRNTQALEAYHFHEAVLNKARYALGYLPQEKRSYYALTLPLPADMVAEVINDFYQLRDRVVEKVNRRGKDYAEVYQMNFQFFPATQRAPVRGAKKQPCDDDSVAGRPPGNDIPVDNRAGAIGSADNRVLAPPNQDEDGPDDSEY